MTHATTADGLEAYPYDPSLKMDALSGLERLRCIADRELAAHLFILFEHAQRNTQAAARGAASRPCEFDTERLRLLAARALGGELGSEPKELAECMLSDEAGTLDDRSVREFLMALRELRRLSR
jgi:hypothetical protein